MNREWRPDPGDSLLLRPLLLLRQEISRQGARWGGLAAQWDRGALSPASGCREGRLACEIHRSVTANRVALAAGWIPNMRRDFRSCSTVNATIGSCSTCRRCRSRPARRRHSSSCGLPATKPWTSRRYW